jgi:hypothetical protein
MLDTEETPIKGGEPPKTTGWEDFENLDVYEEPKSIEYWENRPEVYEMTFVDFAKEYEECQKTAERKESEGNLDPHASGYVPMTDEEVALHQKDWREFSRLRGFSEEDIAEYARWHKLSGQTDGFEYAINDPWRRPRPHWDEQLYEQHIKRAVELGTKVPDEIMASYNELVKRAQERDAHRGLAHTSPAETTQPEIASVDETDWVDLWREQ